MRAEDLPILHAPYVKGKGFDPAPIISKGIPDRADGVKNPNVIGTPEYEIFWQEQLYRCVNGYNTGGIFIPGRFYYYMNFNHMNTINGVITPDYCDLHLELTYIIDWCKANGKNLIIGKKRRAGVSEFTQKAVIDYDYRFLEASQSGIAAGQKKYAEDFMTKWEDSDALLVPEFKMNTLINNPNEVHSGYEVKENGKSVNKGNKSKIFVRTMHDNPGMFKGLFLNNVVAEESGEFDHLCEFIDDTSDCLWDGDLQIGIMLIYGTGGKINKGSKDFKKIWDKPEEYNCVKFLIAGDRFKKPFYGGATRGGVDISDTPNLLKKYKPYQIIGMEDREAAISSIMERRAVLRKGPAEKYFKYLQNNPISEDEIFRKMAGNDFDIEKINEQEHLRSISKDKYSKYKLEWVLNDKGDRVNPLRVKAVPAKDIDKESDCVLIMDEYHPNAKFQHLYVGGIDAYDQDKATSSKSLGAMCVLMRRNTIHPDFQLGPVAVICTRPARKEMFFDMCLKLSVYYNLVGNTLGDKASSSGIINWYKDNGCQKYLAVRPTKFESTNSEQSHEYWVSLNTYSRPMMVGLMQTAVYDYVQNIWFKDLLDQLGDFDSVAIGSDNDLADAYGIALMQDSSLSVSPRDLNYNSKDDPFILNDFNEDDSDEKRVSPEQDWKGFGK